MRFLSVAVTTALLCGAALHHTVAGQLRQRDVPYGPDPAQRVDLLLPAARGFATVVFVHGGSLSSGDKADADYAKVCDPFPGAGIGCVSINYRLAPTHRWPAQAEDVARAVAWVRQNIPALGGDANRVVLFGHSSGATLVALLGSDARYLGAVGLSRRDVRGVIPMGSVMWDDELEQAINRFGRTRVQEAFSRDPDNRMYEGMDQYLDRWPMRHVTGDMPPFLFLIADEEQEQPPVLRTNLGFITRARSLGNNADHRVLPQRDHYSAIHRIAESGDPTFAILTQFIQRVTAPPGG